MKRDRKEEERRRVHREDVAQWYAEACQEAECNYSQMAPTG